MARPIGRGHGVGKLDGPGGTRAKPQSKNHPTPPPDRARPYRHLLPVRIFGHGANALVDSGNLGRCAMSPRFAGHLGYSRKDLVPVPGLTAINLAQKGATIRVLGQLPQAVPLYIKDYGHAFPCRPLVLEDLSHDLNLAGPWLQRNGLNQIHTRDALSHKGRLLPLLCQLQPNKDPEPSFGRIFLKGNHTIPPMVAAIIPAVVPAVAGKDLPAGEGLLRGST